MGRSYRGLLTAPRHIWVSCALNHHQPVRRPKEHHRDGRCSSRSNCYHTNLARGYRRYPRVLPKQISPAYPIAVGRSFRGLLTAPRHIWVSCALASLQDFPRMALCNIRAWMPLNTLEYLGTVHTEKIKQAPENLCFYISVMILPQEHLQKPCYDFYFL